MEIDWADFLSKIVALWFVTIEIDGESPTGNAVSYRIVKLWRAA